MVTFINVCCLFEWMGSCLLCWSLLICVSFRYKRFGLKQINHWYRNEMLIPAWYLNESKPLIPKSNPKLKLGLHKTWGLMQSELSKRLQSSKLSNLQTSEMDSFFNMLWDQDMDMGVDKQFYDPVLRENELKKQQAEQARLMELKKKQAQQVPRTQTLVFHQLSTFILPNYVRTMWACMHIERRE